MIVTDEPRIHGITTSPEDEGVEVYYEYPGSLEVRVIAGVTMPAAYRPQHIVLGRFLADADRQDARDDRSWRWPADTKSTTRRWAQHVLAADARRESLVYEHDGEIVLIWAFIPGRAQELALLEAIGFQLQNFLSLRDSVDGDQVYMSTTNDSQITLNTAHTSKHSSTYISIDLKSYLISLFIVLIETKKNF